MDVALGQMHELFFQFDFNVLILVVMDVALGHSRITLECIHLIVLILVVMDVALGLQAESDKRYADALS